MALTPVDLARSPSWIIANGLRAVISAYRCSTSVFTNNLSLPRRATLKNERGEHESKSLFAQR